MIHAVEEVHIAVRAHSGAENALKRWESTARYLSAHIPGHHFRIIPFEEIDALARAVGRGDVHYVITQPYAYVELEMHHGASRLLTLETRMGQTRFSSIIFTRSDHASIRTLKDLKGKRFMAVAPKAFGGWLMALRELRKQGLDPEKDFAELLFGKFQEAVVRAVVSGKVDAGTVRTGIVEIMVARGEIGRDSIRILNRKSTGGFPYIYSTELYPEWALAQTRRATPGLTRKVIQVLIRMPAASQAAISGRYNGWTVPLSYKPVHDLMHDLGIGPYHEPEHFNLLDLLLKYWYWVAAIVALLLASLFTIGYVRRLNSDLKKESRERQRLVDHMQYLATHDALTSVPNRYLFMDRLGEAFKRTRRQKGLMALCFIDIDNFKDINDRYGHAVGDDVLVETAERLAGSVRESDTVGRFAGDEFVVLLEGNMTGEDVHDVAGKLFMRACENVHSGDVVIPVSVSMGVVISSGSGTSTTALLNRADELMYMAKQEGKMRFMVDDQGNVSSVSL